MQLSIGMIVKNEEKYLEQCLTALQPILNSLDSELIIADTGSTDNTVEIAKKFTDNVYHFEWINDFAAARNSTLERAQGEWYMFIDADEIFQSCDNIINFFKSGEYKKYTYASYTIRNYSDLNNRSSYSDHYGLRMCRKTPVTRFMGAIHEGFDTLSTQNILKFIPDVADHYGYVFESDEELRNSKIYRNLDMLKKIVEEEDFQNHLLVYKQIADCYSVLNDYDKALENIDIGIKKITEIDPDGIGVIDYYVKKFQILYRLRKIKELIEECEKFYDLKFIKKRGAFFSDIEIRFLYADSLKRMNRIDDAIAQYSECFRLIRADKNGKLDSVDKLLGNRIYTADNSITSIVNHFALVCVLTKKFGTLEEHLKILPIEDYYDDHKYIDFRVNLQFEIMDHLGYKNLPKWYSKLDEYGKSAFNKFARHGLFFTDNQAERIDAILKLKTEDENLIDIFTLFREYLCNNCKDVTPICSFAEKYGYENYPELFYLMMFINADITPFVNSEFFGEEYINKMNDRFNNLSENYYAYDIDALSLEGIEKTALMNRIFIFRAIAKKQSYDKALESYAKLGNKWHNDSEIDDAPAMIKECIIIGNVLRSFDNKDYKTCLAYLRDLIAASKDFMFVARDYQQKIKDAVNMAKKPNVNSQLAQMAASVKKNVRDMIAAGNYAAAEKTLGELAQILPGDPEIDMLFEEIEKSR